jgi:hypothetical protein
VKKLSYKCIFKNKPESELFNSYFVNNKGEESPNPYGGDPPLTPNIMGIVG